MSSSGPRRAEGKDAHTKTNRLDKARSGKSNRKTVIGVAEAAVLGSVEVNREAAVNISHVFTSSGVCYDWNDERKQKIQAYL